MSDIAYQFIINFISLLSCIQSQVLNFNALFSAFEVIPIMFKYKIHSLNLISANENDVRVSIIFRGAI